METGALTSELAEDHRDTDEEQDGRHDELKDREPDIDQGKRCAYHLL
jgi:hypothetical protein